MYSSLDDLKVLQTEQVLLQLCDDDGDAEFQENPENTAYRIVISAISEADATIDSYLSGRYTVPIASPVPLIISKISANLALCNLYDRRRELDVPEGIKDRRQRYINFLKDVKAQKADIIELNDNGSAGDVASAAVVASCPEQTFSDTLLNQM